MLVRKQIIYGESHLSEMRGAGISYAAVLRAADCWPTQTQRNQAQPEASGGIMLTCTRSSFGQGNTLRHNRYRCWSGQAAAVLVYAHAAGVCAAVLVQYC